MNDAYRAEQIALLIERLDAIPMPGPAKGRRYGLHPKQREVFAAELYDKGIRVDPTQQTIFPVPGQRRGAMPYTNLADWVDADAYREYLAANPGAAAVAARAEKPSVTQLEAAVAGFDPELAERLKTMSPAERDAARAEFAAKVPAALQRLAEIADRNHGMQQAALRSHGTKGGASQ